MYVYIYIYREREREIDYAHLMYAVGELWKHLSLK